MTSNQVNRVISDAQENIEAMGDTAKTQLLNFGTAVMNGAENIKIKALAKGTIIYAVLQSIQSVLFGNVNSKGVDFNADVKGEFVRSVYFSEKDLQIDLYKVISPLRPEKN